MRASKALLAIASAGSLAAALSMPSAIAAGASSTSSTSTASHTHLDCGQSGRLCTEVDNYDTIFGDNHYVGHDEPSVLFYSHTPGSGANMQYTGMLPKDPPPQPIIGKRSYNFQLYVAFWYGMAMCDTQSYPETVKTCPPASDRNIVGPGNPNHAGTAYMELQFYPPGWAPWPAGDSCSAKQWCVALNIDSLSENPVTGQVLNPTCAAKTGLEYVNFAFLTKSGRSQAPANPVNATLATYTPDQNKDLFLNSGDRYTVRLLDTPEGLRTVVRDTTTGVTGLMTASARNGFGQVKFAPTGTTCKNIPYDFHPEYSTSTPQTRVPWAAATYNIAYDSEIGHFDYCSNVPTVGGNCTGEEGYYTTGHHPSDKDDTYCFPASFSTLVPVSGCLGSNVGFDGTSYLPDWPNGDTNMTPTPTIFTSPLTGADFDTQYSQVAFNTDLPRIEDPTFSPWNNCQRETTGAGCIKPPNTDDGVPASFYPYYTSGNALGGCAWTVGQTVPRFSTRSYGGLAEYGNLQKVEYVGLGGTPTYRYNDFNKVLPNNPCPARR